MRHILLLCTTCSQVIFDCGLGDLYVVRIAAHSIDAAALGSIEFAVERLGALAIVVLGHERCSAIAAAVDAFKHPTDGASSSALPAAGGTSAASGTGSGASVIGGNGATVAPVLAAGSSVLVNQLIPAVLAAADAIVMASPAGTPRESIATDDLVEVTVRTQVALTAKALTERSPFLAQRLREGRLALKGYRYDINSPANEHGHGEFILHNHSELILLWVHLRRKAGQGFNLNLDPCSGLSPSTQPWRKSSLPHWH